MHRASLIALFVLGGCGEVVAPTPDDGGLVDLAAAGRVDDLSSTPPDLTGAGPPDLGRAYSTDPNTFFGASRCATLGAILCDDFESGAPGGAPNAQIWQASGDVTLDVAQFARGKQSLHLHLVGQNWATITETKTFPAMNNHFCGRLFFRATAIPTTNPSAAHWTLVAGSGNNTAEIREGGISGKWGTGTDNRTATGTGDWTNADDDPPGKAKPVPSNVWACIEWEYDGAKNETRFWWDGVEHPSMHTTSTMHGGTQTVPYLLPQFTKLTIGWMLYQAPVNPTTFDIWIDEIAIDEKRIGCNN